jgi:hypothetical protein
MSIPDKWALNYSPYSAISSCGKAGYILKIIESAEYTGATQ